MTGLVKLAAKIQNEHDIAVKKNKYMRSMIEELYRSNSKITNDRYREMCSELAKMEKGCYP